MKAQQVFDMKVEVPKDSIYLAKDIITKQYVFVYWGMKYTQNRYILIASIDANEVMELLNKGQDS